jgi:hypothetical protein
MNNKIAFILFSSGILAACGGGGGSSAPSKPTAPASSTPANSSISSTATSVATSAVTSTAASSTAASATILQGQFKDTNIAGLHFVSGGQSGTTNSTGTFNYEQGENISFSLGGITFGTTAGKALITPIDLIASGKSTDTAVQNMVRFLLMLDSDGYAKNGIQISSAVQTAAASWTQIDFASATFSTDATTYMMAATTADGGAHLLPDSASAQAHLEATHLCAFSGAYQGSVSDATNAVTGNVALYLDALTGNVSGFSYNTSNSNLVDLSNSAAITHQQNVSFMLSSNDINYSGEFISASALNGTWTQDNNTGSFSGTRLNGAATAVYRFNASFTGSDSGVMTLDLDKDKKVTGASYDVKNNTAKTITGTLVGLQLNASIANDMQLEGMLSTEDGTLSGTWSNASKGTSGTFSGSGCQLNPTPLSINGFRDWKTGKETTSIQLIPASGTDPLILLDGSPVARVRMNVKPWGEMSFPITYIEPNGEAAKVDLSNSSFVEITYQSNQSVNLQLRQYAVHGGTHNQITLSAAATFTTVKIPLSDFVGGLTPLDLTNVAKFDFALLSNNANDGYAELIVKQFRIDNFN